MEGYHSSVLLKEALGALNIRDAWYIDCTLGDGGHSIEIISRGGKVVGIDVDPQALGRVQKRFKDLGISEDRYKLVLGNFRDLKNLIWDKQAEPGKLRFEGVLFDLGVSSLQLESPERGFSFMSDGPLDMRMDPTLEVSASDLINAGGRKELSELFSRLGEEKYSWTLADAVVRTRKVDRIETTRQLAQIIENVTGRKRGKIHPATKVFQALRIAVNDELGVLQEGLGQVIDLIEGNGRIVVISFHSLEDRIAKFTFRKWQTEGFGQVLTKKPITPGFLEIKMNPRSRSAKLRVFEKGI